MGHALLQTEPYVSPEDYLAAEAEAETRHEYARGEVIAMAGASRQHNQITTNLTTELNVRLRKRGCHVASSDQRVRTQGDEYRYPDAVVYCGAGRFVGELDTLTNPELLIEVTSASTSETDRSDKLEEYTQIESAREYWIVEQDQALVTQYVRRDDRWEVRFARGLETSLRSEHFGVEIPMADVYALVELPAPPGRPGETGEADV